MQVTGVKECKRTEQKKTGGKEENKSGNCEDLSSKKTNKNMNKNKMKKKKAKTVRRVQRLALFPLLTHVCHRQTKDNNQ